jgi:AcrR family transcriptional regulator
MTTKVRGRARREESLSRERIVEAAIELLDSSGEGGLTFRALSDRLATGPGAIYGHVANKSELVTAACDAVVARTMNARVAGRTPEAVIRELALGLFDTIDAHPWVGSALTLVPGQLAAVRMLEGIGQQVRALGVPRNSEWATVAALLSYILGVGGQNAANGERARTRGMDRSAFLEALSITWSELDPQVYPFTCSVAGQLPAHDDRADFLAGIDLILSGIESRRRPGRASKERGEAGPSLRSG